MKRFGGIIATGLIAVVLLAIGYDKLVISPSKQSAGNSFAVKKVVDGDTVEVDYYGQLVKIRLIGIDTPEVVDPRKPVQCFGKEASARAHNLLDGQRVSLELDPLVGETDKYGRKLAYIFMANGDNFALRMIQDGYAHEYTYQAQSYHYQADFKRAQTEAEAAQRGLWSANACNGDTKQPAYQAS